MSNTLTLLDSLEALAGWQQEQRNQARTIGLVPTMGNLHAGHISLIAAAKAAHDLVIATIFVNPMQFGPNEDLDKYPRTLAADASALHAAGCDALFTPTAAMLYPMGLQAHTSIRVPVLSTLHCGQIRPGHFDGVCTVVCKLFNLIAADSAYFGMKDYQQFRIISRMVNDLNIKIKLCGRPTVRETDGLALSSRNGYLSDQQRQIAPGLYRTLQQAAADLRQEHSDLREVEQAAVRSLQALGFVPDYVSICDQYSLLPANSADAPLVILAAATLGSTRLIDNIQV